MSAVANILTSILTSALSLRDVEGAATQSLFVTLDGEVDASVYALETAPTAPAFTSAQQQYALVFSTFGEDGLKLGAELRSEADVFGVADLLLAGQGRGAGAAHAPFGVFDRQLFATASDFGALGVNIKSLGTIASQDDLTGVVGSLSDDSAALAADFSALSADVAPLAHDLSALGSGSPFAPVGAAMQPLASEYAAIATDFGNMFALYNGATVSSTGAPISFGSVFKSLDTDLIKLDNSMHGLAAPLANAMTASLFGGGRCCE